MSCPHPLSLRQQWYLSPTCAPRLNPIILAYATMVALNRQRQRQSPQIGTWAHVASENSIQEVQSSIRVTNAGPVSQNTRTTSTDSSPPSKPIPAAVAEENTSSFTVQPLPRTTTASVESQES